ncbi:MAG: hypothetical protein Q8O03_01485 [Nanoarchaeota archaeon]|nr:hypothetical protein [Nanoarchaeota archaeon]
MGWLIGSGMFLLFLGLSVRELEEIGLLLAGVGLLVFVAGIVRKIKERIKKK